MPSSAAKVDIGRRNFLRGAALTAKGRQALVRQQAPLGPSPPGMSVLVEQDFCNRCDQACVSACEQHIIAIHPAGHSLAGYPWLDFSVAGCTFCGKCVAACPLDQSLNDSTTVAGQLTIEQGRCLSWNGVLCMSCVSACQQRAISLDKQRRLVITSGNCNGCGGCVSTCPVGVLAVTASREV